MRRLSSSVRSLLVKAAFFNLISDSFSIRLFPDDPTVIDELDSNFWYCELGIEPKDNAEEVPACGRQLDAHEQRLKLENVVVREERPLPSDHLVTSLPLLDKNEFKTAHYAGYLPASADGDKKLFYWLVAPDFRSEKNGKRTTKNLDDAPLVVWLNGGPGCSSMTGLFIENGPFRLRRTHTANKRGTKDPWKIQINEFSWHLLPAWLLYVDQPVGSGLSFTRSKDYRTDDDGINADFYYFFRQFLFMYKDTFVTFSGQVSGDSPSAHKPPNREEDDFSTERWRTSRQVYVTGESHAGHYIGSLIDYILQKNSEILSNDTRQREGGSTSDSNNDSGQGDNDADSDPPLVIHIDGGAIGNGWIDPYHQYSAAEKAYGRGVVDQAQMTVLLEIERKCRSYLDAGKLFRNGCGQPHGMVENNWRGNTSAFVVSPYSLSYWERRGSMRTFPPGRDELTCYLGGAAYCDKALRNRKSTDVLEAIHALESLEVNQTYKECSGSVFKPLHKRDSFGVVDEIVRILDHPTQPRLLFYNGMDDLVCHDVGVDHALSELPWSEAPAWALAVRSAWTGTNSGAPHSLWGYVKQHKNLIFMTLLDSGHMVPLDQPERAFVMMHNFVHGTSFGGSGQNLGRSDPREHCDPPCPSCDYFPKSEAPAKKQGDTFALESSGAPSTPPKSGMTTYLLFGVIILLMWAALCLIGLRRRTRERIQYRSVPTEQLCSKN